MSANPNPETEANGAKVIASQNSVEDESERSTTEAHGPGKGKPGSTSDGTSTGGPDSDVGSVDELPIEGLDGEEGKKGVSEDLTQKVSASANYIGSIFSTAWKTTAKTAGDATANSSNLLSSAFNKVTAATASAKTSPKEETAKPLGEGEEAETGENMATATPTEEVKEPASPSTQTQAAAATAAASSFLSSAWNNFGLTGKGSEKPEKEEADGEQTEKENGEAGKFGYGNGLAGLTSAFSAVGKAATDATNVLKDKVAEVGTTNMLSEFTKEQETFIKTKSASHSEMGIAPWVGYHEEDELKAKILALSEDKRTFVRAPPSGVTFEFEYASVSSTALALLQEDPRLQKMRYELVPKKVKEEEFWRNYFYRVSLIKQSFELKDLEEGEKKVKKAQKGQSSTTSSITGGDIADEVEISNDHGDDEFVSDSYQASTTDIAEAEDSIKKLGVEAKGAEEWEAELEGELNEFEVVNGKDEDSNREWENQIDEMLEEEEQKA